MKVDLSRALDPVRNAMIEASTSSKLRLSVIGGDTPCKAGCNHCCSRLVSISLAEAAIMVERLKADGQWTAVEKRAVEIEQLSKEVDGITWFKMNIKCPVLNPETGLCEAYEVRPATCSTHFVMSSPNSCDPWSTEPMNYVPVDMVDLHANFVKTLERECGKGIMSVPLPLPAAIRVSSRLVSRNGMTLDEAMALIARET